MLPAIITAILKALGDSITSLILKFVDQQQHDAQQRELQRLTDANAGLAQVAAQGTQRETVKKTVDKLSDADLLSGLRA